MLSILIIINYIVSNFPIAVNHFILDTNGFYLITQMQHNTLWCVCWFFSPLSLSPDQLSGTPPGPSCYWQYSAVSQALFWVSVPSPTDPRTGESAPVASPWFCQVTVKTQGNPEEQRERECVSVYESGVQVCFCPTFHISAHIWSQDFLHFWRWQFIPAWQWRSLANASRPGVSPGPTSLVGWPSSWPLLQVCSECCLCGRLNLW